MTQEEMLLNLHKRINAACKKELAKSENKCYHKALMEKIIRSEKAIELLSNKKGD